MKLILITLLALAASLGQLKADGKVDTIDGTNQMIDKIMTDPVNEFGHYIILDHDAVFHQVVGNSVDRWDCYVTYAIDLGYGYSRGPFRLRITLQPDPTHRYKWHTFLDVIAL
jgi:hypothetical protein